MLAPTKLGAATLPGARRTTPPTCRRRAGGTCASGWVTILRQGTQRSMAPVQWVAALRGGWDHDEVGPGRERSGAEGLGVAQVADPNTGVDIALVVAAVGLAYVTGIASRPPSTAPGRPSSS